MASRTAALQLPWLWDPWTQSLKFIDRVSGTLGGLALCLRIWWFVLSLPGCAAGSFSKWLWLCGTGPQKTPLLSKTAFPESGKLKKQRGPT